MLIDQEMYKKHRPKLFKRVLGQRDAVKTLETLLKDIKKFPHALLFTGPSGCGKTTLARIIKAKLGCGDSDYSEVDCADFRGIDMVREIRTRMRGAPIAGKCRIWLIDEAQQMTGDAQNALLKILEDTPRHVYFMLATTDPGKLKKTIITRSTEIKVASLARQDMNDLIAFVAEKEDIELSEECVAKITEVADGSARKALVVLNQIAQIENEDERLSAILSSDSKRQGIEIARALLNPKTSWGDMAKILKGVDEDPEQLRYLILGYASTIMLSGNKMTPRANLIIQVFQDNLYDSKRAGLITRCYECLSTKSRQ